MKRRFFAAVAALSLILALAVPAGAARMDTLHVLAASGEGSVMPLIVGVGIAGLICFGLVSLQKSVHKKTGASDYITGEGVQISQASDRFTHRTQTRRKLQNTRK